MTRALDILEVRKLLEVWSEVEEVQQNFHCRHDQKIFWLSYGSEVEEVEEVVVEVVVEEEVEEVP